ncbi:MAG: AbrB/MazE/SpoVT family DNA-binding domain-containing protein [Candidatus Hydrogenedentes bacterium]|nr:AbrB/MazE/SpoVT family DNA-binding domain-containing protein [Candidatus Hydrogenedentota bacterium]
MITKVQPWGNSQGLRLGKQVLADAGINVGDEVDVRVENGQIVIARTSPIRGKYRIEDLVAQIPLGYQPEECDWGAPKGKEVW